MSAFVYSFSDLIGERQSSAGGKGGSLARMFQAGFPVPDGFVILPDAFVNGDLRSEAIAQFARHLDVLRAGDDEAVFAVRSSALSEDSAEASFAGEFESVLNVKSEAEVLDAVRHVYASRENDRVKAYSDVHGMDASHEIAVVIQLLADADSSGVMFTVNPVSGLRHHIMITAAWGLGEAVVGGIVTPDTIIVDKETGSVVQRETADKQVMTVRLDTGTEEKPAPDDLRFRDVLTDAEAARLSRLGVRIESFYGQPMDIEWVLADGQFIIVQARPVTTLAEHDDVLEYTWKLPRGMYAAMRNNIVELMTDPLSPLFRTLGLEAVNVSMNRTLSEAFNGEGLMPEKLIITVNDYAYYNGSLKPLQMLRMFLKSGAILKMMFSSPVERWTDQGRPQYVQTVADWESRAWQSMSSRELVEGAYVLTEAAVNAYMSLVAGVIPAAWITEGIYTAVYNLIVKRRDDPEAYVCLLGFDSLPIVAEKSLFALAQQTAQVPGLSEYLSQTPAGQVATALRTDATPEGVPANAWQNWQGLFRAYLKDYGFTIYNLDFASPVPADDPVPLLDMFQHFLSGQGIDPSARQHESVSRREQAVSAIRNRLGGLRLRLFETTLLKAQRYAPLREDGLAEIGMSYPLIRQMLAEVGERFVQAGVFTSPVDIYYLEKDEVLGVADSLERGQPGDDLSGVVARRKADLRRVSRVAPPMMLPQIRLFGKDLAELKAKRSRGSDGEMLKGVAASPGTVTARAAVLHGPGDFDQMQAGYVLVASMTTPAWTPLFARAVAVITDIGGPLSHGSIVAREYGIPAVLGTGTATERIRTGQLVTVDGSTGTVTIIEPDDALKTAA